MEAEIKEGSKKSRIIVCAVIVILTLSLFGCFPAVNKLELKCERHAFPYVEDGSYVSHLLALIEAMNEKALAGYMLGYSDIIVQQKLKDDFESHYTLWERNYLREDFLRAGFSCGDALRAAGYHDAPRYKDSFRNSALSAMVSAQRRMADFSTKTLTPADREYAKKVLDRTTEEAIKAAELQIHKGEISNYLHRVGFSHEEIKYYIKKTDEMRKSGVKYLMIRDYLKFQKPQQDKDKK